MKHKAEKWMQSVSEKIKESGHSGKLRKKLHVKAGHKITAKQLAKGAKSKSPTERKEVALAKVFKRTRKRG